MDDNISIDLSIHLPIDLPIDSPNQEKKNCEYEETLIIWKEQCRLDHYVYETTYDTFNRIQKIFGILILIFTTITTFLSVAGVIQPIVILFSCMTTFFSSLGQLYDINERTQSYLDYMKDLQEFYILIENREFLPKDIKEAPRDFVIRQKDNFLKMMSSAPEIPSFIYNRYMHNYAKDKTHPRRTKKLFKITS